MFRNVLPPTYLAVAIILIFFIHFILPLGNPVGMPWRLLGLVPLVLGGVLNLVADSSFKRHETTVKPFRESRILVTSGVFRISRHPMYLGFVLILLGIAVLLGSLSPYLVVIGFAIFLEMVFIREEERMLEEQFRQQWNNYRARVRKWI
jgi:protein-S-isoprenylcysteine O-methyltransferase Ste14